MKFFALTLLVFLAAISAAGASPAPPIVPLHSSMPLVHADWQEPLSLPRRLRNHCAIDAWSGRPYCSDHCGFNYQVYSCSPQSFGCCRIGFGYCDWNGLLRCHP